MALECFNCKKGIMYGHKVSHAKNRTNRIFKPNLHIVRVVIDGTPMRVRLCTKCLRRYKKKFVSKVVAPSPTAAITQ